MTGYWLYVVRGLLLLTAITLISYSMVTPGPQSWQMAIGGAVGMLSVTSQSFQDKP